MTTTEQATRSRPAYREVEVDLEVRRREAAGRRRRHPDARRTRAARTCRSGLRARTST